ncbi:MAG: SufS family cysteine desulfurase [Lachnospiraceae bacterium]|nr:SufS family cysteine desulfurase [Lachnospiraceae bacterium]
MTPADISIREEFPLINNNTVAYLDNAATTQKPKCVLDAVEKYYVNQNANPMRGLYDLSLQATQAYEDARAAAAELIGASSEEIVFTRNATESLNLIAYSYGLHNIKAGDEIIVSVVEHHSNFLPWKNVADHTGARIVYWDCEADGYLDPDTLTGLISKRTKLVAVTHVSNVLGRVNDIQRVAHIAHSYGALIVCDGSQSVPHMKTDVHDLDVDFFVFSGHKMYAPMGIGVLYGRRELLDAMPPFLYGGEMIETVTKDRVTYAEVPHKFEAGTVNAGGAVGLHAAIGFMNRYGYELIESRERELTRHAFEEMSAMPYITILGSERWEEHGGIIAFKVEGVHPHDVTAIFSDADIAVRAGHHCAQPLHKHLGVMSSTRVSMAFYNTMEEVDRFLDVLSGIRAKMGY